MKKLISVLCAVFIMAMSSVLVGCGSLSESDLPDESKNIVIEWKANGGLIKPDDMPCTPHFASVYKYTANLLDKLNPEVKDAILDQVSKVENIEVYNPMNQNGYIMVPVKIEYTNYLKTYPDYKFRGGNHLMVVWEKVDGKWLVDDIIVNQKSFRSNLENLEYNLDAYAYNALRMREKAKAQK